jgi:hypothetical protein
MKCRERALSLSHLTVRGAIQVYAVSREFVLLENPLYCHLLRLNDFIPMPSLKKNLKT